MDHWDKRSEGSQPYGGERGYSREPSDSGMPKPKKPRKPRPGPKKPPKPKSPSPSPSPPPTPPPEQHKASMGSSVHYSHGGYDPGYAVPAAPYQQPQSANPQNYGMTLGYGATTSGYGAMADSSRAIETGYSTSRSMAVGDYAQASGEQQFPESASPQSYPHGAHQGQQPYNPAYSEQNYQQYGYYQGAYDPSNHGGQGGTN